MNFLPEDYKEPVKSNYMKFDQGENNFRILSSAIIGWEYWVDAKNEEGKSVRKPIRVKEEASINISEVPDPREIKYFWAFVVYNLDNKKIQILEITQAGIKKAILALTKNKKWGDPKNYDITVNRTGEGMETEYQVTPNPKEELDKEIVAKYEAMKINLEALYENGDPFENAGSDSDSGLSPEDIKDIDETFGK